MFQVDLDDNIKLVRIGVSGWLTTHDVREFNVNVLTILEQARDRFGKVRMLIDARDIPVQSQEVCDSFETPEIYIKGPDERVATVVASSLAKMQANRVVIDVRCQTFSTIEAAEAWLVAD